MTKLIDLDEVRKTWTSRFGATAARAMMAGAGVAYDSRYGRDQEQGELTNRRSPGSPDLIPGSKQNFNLRKERDGDWGEGADQDDGLDAIKVFLKSRLSPEDYQRLQQMIQALGEGGEESPADDPRQEAPSPEEGAQDMPPPFRGRPTPGGSKLGQDARGSSYFDRFPSNAAVGTFDYGSGGR
ncbi:hypothetical protein [Roseiarcus sp.]|uniref:hypothetical protein n=1 Tax=Roseiarcus sp. TaxID=1969460 RepID=UPI003F9E68EF